MLTLLGYAIQLFSLLVVAFPKVVLEAAPCITMTTRLRVTIVVLRVLFGGVIIWAAPLTKFPLAVLTIGVFSVSLGIATLFVSNSTLQSRRDWFFRHGPNVIRAGGVVGLLFGGFLAYVA